MSEPTCAYQGIAGSYSHTAVCQFFKEGIDAIGKEQFEDVFHALEQGLVDFAAIPVENSLIGPIVENLDLLSAHNVSIMGELYLPIRHCLIGIKGQKIQEIQTVLSHPKALDQCKGFFKTHPWIKPTVHFDTAGAVSTVAKSENEHMAAIASGLAADVYSLEILQRDLEDDQTNTTRFLFVRNKKNEEQIRGQKCSIMFTVKHESGSLLSVLNVLEKQGANLTQIVSRPIKNRPFEYLFFVDFLGNMDQTNLLSSLKEVTQTLKLLGCYEPSH